MPNRLKHALASLKECLWTILRQGSQRLTSMLSAAEVTLQFPFRVGLRTTSLQCKSCQETLTSDTRTVLLCKVSTPRRQQMANTKVKNWPWGVQSTSRKATLLSKRLLEGLFQTEVFCRLLESPTRMLMASHCPNIQPQSACATPDRETKSILAQLRSRTLTTKCIKPIFRVHTRCKATRRMCHLLTINKNKAIQGRAKPKCSPIVCKMAKNWKRPAVLTWLTRWIPSKNYSQTEAQAPLL